MLETGQSRAAARCDKDDVVAFFDGVLREARVGSIRDHDGCFELQLLLLKPMSGLRRVKGKRAKAFPAQNSDVGRAFQGGNKGVLHRGVEASFRAGGAQDKAVGR